MSSNVLRETNFDNLGEKTTGKVRDIYDAGDGELTLITTDRHSSFDRIIAHIPNKGQVLNETSGFWFDNTREIVPNHIIAIPDPNVSVVKRTVPLPIEVVVRGFITGSTNTSLWTLYKEGQRDFGNFILPDGMTKNERLVDPVFTPTTKSNEHDRPITPAEIVSEGLMSPELLAQVEEVAKKIFLLGQGTAKERGLVLVDTKYEFGLDENGNLYLIDEVHTPDSSRYWRLDTYLERLREGREPDNFDKEFLRLWFKENSDPYNDEVLPEAPEELVAELSRRYRGIYEDITGQKFVEHDGPIEERIERNMVAYRGER